MGGRAADTSEGEGSRASVSSDRGCSECLARVTTNVHSNSPYHVNIDVLIIDGTQTQGMAWLQVLLPL